MAFAGTEPYWRRRRFDRAIATGASGSNRRHSSRFSASRFSRGDRETSSEGSGESGGDRAARGMALERAEAGRRGTRSKGRAKNQPTSGCQRRAGKGNCRAQAGGREAAAKRGLLGGSAEVDSYRQLGTQRRHRGDHPLIRGTLPLVWLRSRRGSTVIRSALPEGSSGGSRP